MYKRLLSVGVLKDTEGHCEAYALSVLEDNGAIEYLAPHAGSCSSPQAAMIMSVLRLRCAWSGRTLAPPGSSKPSSCVAIVHVIKLPPVSSPARC